MATKETDIVNRIMLRLSPMGTVLFRNVRGMFLTLDGQRKVKAGLMADGSSDLIGFTRVLITPDMCGQILPILTCIEVKTPTGSVRPEQRKFVDFILSVGGYAGIARSPEDALKIVGTKKT